MKIGRRSANFSFSFLRVNIRPSKLVLRRSPKKKVFKHFFQAINKISTTQKILLFSSREQGNLEDLRPRTWPSRPRTWPSRPWYIYQRWIPRGRILMSSASKVMSLALALSPQKLACSRLEDSSIFWVVKILWIAGKKIFEELFFREHLRLCPWRWPHSFLSLASRGSVLEGLSLASDFFVSLALASSLVSSTPLRRVARIWKKGGVFERVRKLQTTLTRIFIVLESESHGLSDFGRFILKIETDFSAKIGNSNLFQPKNRWSPKKIETDFSAKIGNSNAFSALKEVISKKNKKRSSPKLRRIFWPKSEIQTLFQAESRHLLHNFGTQFRLGGLFSFFHQKSVSKALKTCDFAHFTGQ